MNNLSKKFEYTLDTKKGFGNMVDVFQSITFLQVIYCIMLTIDYNRYQNGNNSFQPLKYLTLFVLMAIILTVEKHIVEMWKLVLIEIVFSILILFISQIDGNKLVYLSGCLVICVRSIFKHRYRYSQSLAYSDRFRTQNRNWILVVMIIASFVYHFLSSDNDENIISTDVCTYYMLTSFAIFIISIIMTKYSFKFYEYFRQKIQENKSTEKQLKYSVMIIFIATITIMAVIFIVFGDLLVPLIESLFGFIQKIIFSIILSLFEIDLSHKRKVNQQFDVSYSDTGIVKNSDALSKSGLSSIFPTLLIIIIVGAIIFVIWKIYKNILANYKIGTDEAEFIPLKEESVIYQEINDKTYRFKYGKNNREKIRKYYFQEIIKRKDKTGEISNKTPSEINKSLRKKQNDKLDEMTKMYEKARYSDDDIEDIEVKNMRELYEKK